MIPLSLHLFNVLLYIPVRFLARGKHIKIFKNFHYFSLHPCNFFLAGDDTLKKFEYNTSMLFFQVEGSHPST